VIGGENDLHLSLEQSEKFFEIKAMPDRPERREISFREPKQPHRRIHPPPVLRMRRPRVLLLQMHEAAGCLDQAFEKIRILRFRLQPEMLEDVVRVIIALLIPAAEKTEIAWMLGNLARRPFRRRAAQLLHESGNSLAFAHEEFSLVSAEMTGNRARIVFPRRAELGTATADG